MHIINFLIAICLPYFTLLSKLAPPDTIPLYFYSDEAAFLGGEFGAVVFYWAGYLRNVIARGKMSERQYFIGAAVLLIFMCATKIIFTLPYSWITNIFAFGLGVLSLSAGQTVGKYSILVIAICSVIILSYSTFILIGMAWFGFGPTAYYEYVEIIQIHAYEYWHQLMTLIRDLKQRFN